VAFTTAATASREKGAVGFTTTSAVALPSSVVSWFSLEAATRTWPLAASSALSTSTKLLGTMLPWAMSNTT
jgi:hypothetical protein